MSINIRRVVRNMLLQNVGLNKLEMVLKLVLGVKLGWNLQVMNMT